MKIKNVTTQRNDILKLNYLKINGETFFAYKEKGDVVTIFPHKDHFYRTKEFDLPVSELRSLVEKLKEGRE